MGLVCLSTMASNACAFYALSRELSLRGLHCPLLLHFWQGGWYELKPNRRGPKGCGKVTYVTYVRYGRQRVANKFVITSRKGSPIEDGTSPPPWPRWNLATTTAPTVVLCEEVNLNLVCRWFCRWVWTARCPIARLLAQPAWPVPAERYPASVFETMVERCCHRGPGPRWVRVDASLIARKRPSLLENNRKMVDIVADRLLGYC
jgi:hypothetical protein